MLLLWLLLLTLPDVARQIRCDHVFQTSTVLTGPLERVQGRLLDLKTPPEHRVAKQHQRDQLAQVRLMTNQGDWSRLRQRLERDLERPKKIQDLCLRRIGQQFIDLEPICQVLECVTRITGATQWAGDQRVIPNVECLERAGEPTGLSPAFVGQFAFGIELAGTLVFGVGVPDQVDFHAVRLPVRSKVCSSLRLEVCDFVLLTTDLQKISR
jgi:hypothetical protein